MKATQRTIIRTAVLAVLAGAVFRVPPAAAEEEVGGSCSGDPINYFDGNHCCNFNWCAVFWDRTQPDRTFVFEDGCTIKFHNGPEGGCCNA